MLYLCTVYMEEGFFLMYLFFTSQTGTGREAKTHQAQKKRARGLIKSFVQNNSCRTRVYERTSSTLGFFSFFLYTALISGEGAERRFSQLHIVSFAVTPPCETMVRNQ